MFSGYIYLRQPGWSVKIIKMGSTDNVRKRDSTYRTGELKRGQYISIYNCNNHPDVEKKLHRQLKIYNIREDGGKEYYNPEIKNLLESELKNLCIEYKKLTENEIIEIEQLCKLDSLNESVEEPIETKLSISNETFQPRDYQIEIINKSIVYFQNNNRGLLILICGIGKTLISLWITLKMGIDKIIIGVPNLLLLEQWTETIKKLTNINILKVDSKCTNKNVLDFLKNNKKAIVITTYASNHKVLNATKQLDYTFGMKILDEVHHITGRDNDKDKKKNIRFLDIKSNKQLSLTATSKELKSSENDIISNTDKKIFGEIISERNLLWGIQNNIICDYEISILVPTDLSLFDSFDIPIDHQEYIFSAFSALKSIFNKESHHILIYSNSKDSSEKIKEYIKLLLDKKYFVLPELFYDSYYGEYDKKKQRKIIREFEDSKFGIICCVYCLGEGWDFPKLNAVVFAEEMSSEIRCVQSALRSGRKNKEEPNKISKLILPIINMDDEKNGFKKIRQVIKQMSLEDETIIQKIKVYNTEIKKCKKFTDIKEINNDTHDVKKTEYLNTKIYNRQSYSMTYKHAKYLLSDKKILSKEEYFNLCNNDIRFNKDPQEIFGDSFVGWCDYFSIERKYYDIKTCKEKIKTYFKENKELIKHRINLNIICDMLCKMDTNFPPLGLWEDYYGSSLREIIIIKGRVFKL